MLRVELVLIVLVLLLLVRRIRKWLVRAESAQEDKKDGLQPIARFAYPTITPSSTPLDKLEPPSYRPFKPGTYHVTMGIRNMEWNDWIEVDKDYIIYRKIRAYRIAVRGSTAVRTMPGRPGVPDGAPAALELMYELAEFLSRRYPTLFTVERCKSKTRYDYGWYDDPQIKSITVHATGETFTLEEGDPMATCAMLIQDDLALMLEGEDGRYYFQAGAICVPGFWRMEDKIGHPLDEIHTRGNVPQFKEKLQPSLTRYFKRLQVDKPVARNNYFFQIAPLPSSRDPTSDIPNLDPEELAWSTSTLGNEDRFAEGEGFHGGLATLPPLTPEEVGPRVRFRTERQTLRRLPRSKAVVFTIRTYMIPVEKIVKEEGAPGRLASAVRGWPDDVQIYKGASRYREALLRYLDDKQREQENMKTS